ncbi:MAG TPA: zinc ribbon domain-containing protein [Nitrososphaerales archaeon]|nr:zinc ribbon domain-containing protein [Nitrososphaerales archaeon]
MNCPNCGTQLPDDAAFCYKCGYQITGQQAGAPGGNSGQRPQAAAPPQKQEPIIAAQGVTSFKCPNCGAPLTPKFGEMVITCEYCGSAVALGGQGWSSISKQSMLPVKIATTDDLNKIINPMMDKGLLHRHLQENSKQEEMSLSYVPYWIVNISARTTVVATDETQQIAQTATTAALMGALLGGGFGGGGGGGGGPRGGGGRRRIFGDGIFDSLYPGAFSIGSIQAWGMGAMGMGGGGRKTDQMDANYNFPVIALKALTAYQPRDYQFDLQGRQLFDITKIPKNIKVLNGDIGEEDAKNQAKTLVDQLQSQKAHAKYHMIQQLNTQMDVGEVELLHTPIWFAKYDHKGNKIILVVDASSGRVINSIGLS